MSKPRSLNPRRNRRRTESSRVSASGAGGGFAASSTSDKKRKSTENEKQVSPNKKKKETDLTGKEIAESIKEGRLAPLADILASQSRQLTRVIEKQATSMLDLYLEISTRKSSVSRFDTLIKNKKTGEEELFAPSCCRIKNPVTGSRSVQDLDEFKLIVNAYKELTDNYKQSARNLLKQAAELEVTTRVKLLKDEVINSLFKIAMNIVIEETLSNVNKGLQVNSDVSKKEIAFQATRQYLLSFTEDMRKAFNFENNEDIKQTFDEFMSKDRDNSNILDFSSRAGENGNRIMFTTKEKISELFPKITIDLWSTFAQRELLRSINEEQAKFNGIKDEEEATKKAAEGVLKDTPIAQSQMKAALKQMFKQELKSQANQARKNLRRASKPRSRTLQAMVQMEKRGRKESTRNHQTTPLRNTKDKRPTKRIRRTYLNIATRKQEELEVATATKEEETEVEEVSTT